MHQGFLFFLDFVCKTIFFQFFYHIWRYDAHCQNCRIHRISCSFVPDNCSFPLVCNTDRCNISGICTNTSHSLYSYCHLGRPDFMRIMFYPSWFRIILRKLLLRQTAVFPALSKQNTAGTAPFPNPLPLRIFRYKYVPPFSAAVCLFSVSLLFPQKRIIRSMPEDFFRKSIPAQEYQARSCTIQTL